MSGCGTGMTGRRANRTARAVTMTVRTASARWRASRPSARSNVLSQVAPRPGRTSATSTMGTTRAISSSQAGRGPLDRRRASLPSARGELFGRLLLRIRGRAPHERSQHAELLKHETYSLADNHEKETNANQHGQRKRIERRPVPGEGIEEAHDDQNGPEHEEYLDDRRVPATHSDGRSRRGRASWLGIRGLAARHGR